MIKGLKKGFTLIELLIVMAIIGVLAVVVLVAINPVQQLARTRDTGRKSTIAQLGRALEAYYTAHNGLYVAESATWIEGLTGSGEMSTVPSEIAYGVAGATGCVGTGGGVQNGWCYDATDVDGTGPVVAFAVLESQSELSKCAVGTPYFVWSTEDGRGGLVCSETEPVPGSQTWTEN